MGILIVLIPSLPLLGFLILTFFGKKMKRSRIAAVGVASVMLSAICASAVFIAFINYRSLFFSQKLWTWMSIDGLQTVIGFYLDSISLVMVMVVTWIGFLIHLYSISFMYDEEGYSRFFSYMNLFVSSMLILVLADNLLFLYLGWEGVGLCSYLLIGFWYQVPENGLAARKAFIVTRVGDTSMALGVFYIFLHLGTLEIQPMMDQAVRNWPVGSKGPELATALLLGGALGKSAQIPLQTWLPDAMAGPTPVSALIHAATMVTAGVYLIARTHVLFSLAPDVEFVVALIGMVTLILSSVNAIQQTDIKRILAYSTMSQIGYMFLALGVGKWSYAIFHLVTHAVFKALLFLSAGAVILACHHEHNIFKMGGLARRIPFIFVTFLIGAASLSAFPLVTSGFYSKDLILSSVYEFPRGGQFLWVLGVLGAFLTSLYAFRLVFIVFWGDSLDRSHNITTRKADIWINLPLTVLSILSIVIGFVKIPDFISHRKLEIGVPEVEYLRLQVVTSVISLLGIVTAYLFFAKKGRLANLLLARIRVSWFRGGEFDWIYDKLFVRPFIFLSNINKNDAVDLIYDQLAKVNQMAFRGLSFTQTGKVREYAIGITIGAVLGIAITLIAGSMI